jgi:hypothetical protein
MHTRRVGAFLIGGWLLGTFLMAFVTSQSLVNVDRILNSPPQQITKEFDDLGPEVARQVLRFEASQLNRHLIETWEVMQLGIGGALLATSFLTAHRSRVVIIGTIIMMLTVAYLYFSLTPTMNQLARSYDFLPAGAAQAERSNYAAFAVWSRVLEILKSAVGVIIAGRLLFDRYDWKTKLIGSPPPAVANGKVRRRRRRTSGSSGEVAATGSSDATVGTSDSAIAEKVDPVDHADDSHVDR